MCYDGWLDRAVSVSRADRPTGWDEEPWLHCFEAALAPLARSHWVQASHPLFIGLSDPGFRSAAVSFQLDPELGTCDCAVPHLQFRDESSVVWYDHGGDCANMSLRECQRDGLQPDTWYYARLRVVCLDANLNSEWQHDQAVARTLPECSWSTNSGRKGRFQCGDGSFCPELPVEPRNETRTSANEMHEMSETNVTRGDNETNVSANQGDNETNVSAARGDNETNATAPRRRLSGGDRAELDSTCYASAPPRRRLSGGDQADLCCETRGKRLRCPPESPVMCANASACARDRRGENETNRRGENETSVDLGDHCCAASDEGCEELGGPRPCPAREHVAAQAPGNLSFTEFGDQWALLTWDPGHVGECEFYTWHVEWRALGHRWETQDDCSAFPRYAPYVFGPSGLALSGQAGGYVEGQAWALREAARAATASCNVTGLRMGTAYDFRVREARGARLSAHRAV